MLDNVFYIFSLKPKDGSNDPHLHMSAKIVIDNDIVHVLEDHEGTFSDLNGKTELDAHKVFDRLARSSRFKVVNQAGIDQGRHPELLEEVESPKEGPSVFLYHRVGVKEPQELKCDDGKWTLDGFDVSLDELKLIVDNVTSGNASIQKLEGDMGKFYKSDDPLFAALGSIRNAVKEGHISPEHFRAITGHIFKDTMIPSMGNKKSYHDFMTRPRPGVHVHIDLNDFGKINKIHGFEAGDEAIKHAGNAVRSAIDESVGKANAKSFRIGGDEFRVHVPTYQHAVALSRTLKNKWDAIAPVKGTHNISGSIGIGESPDQAESSLIQAKGAKVKQAYPEGQAQTHAHSLIPDHEGHLKI